MTRLIWITGAAGAGKTALARAIHQQWRGAQTLLHLDGDQWRQWLGVYGEGYAPAQRLAIGSALARAAVGIASQGIPVVASTISAFAEIGEILATCPVRVLRVRLHAGINELHKRRPALYDRRGDDPHPGPWPYPVDLQLATDAGVSAEQLAAQVLAAL